MTAENRPAERELTCQDCAPLFQDYLDGTLPKTESLALFLHARSCSVCGEQLARWQAVFQSLGELPTADLRDAEGFDAKVLASVPYGAYQAMEPIRRERVPVFLEEAFLPRFIRARTTRVAGLAAAGVGCVGLLAGSGPEVLEAAALLGVVPEILVLLQKVGRRVAATGRRSEI